MSIQKIINELKELQQNTKLIPFYLFHLQPIKNITLRNKITRVLFGRKETTSKLGLIQSHKGIILSTNTFLISSENKQEIFTLLNKNKLQYKHYKIYLEK